MKFLLRKTLRSTQDPEISDVLSRGFPSTPYYDLGNALWDVGLLVMRQDRKAPDPYWNIPRYLFQEHSVEIVKEMLRRGRGTNELEFFAKHFLIRALTQEEEGEVLSKVAYNGRYDRQLRIATVRTAFLNR
jgi:hypothetical protein